MGRTAKYSIVEGIVFDEQPEEAPLAREAAQRAMALLARWAARRAQKLTRLEGGGEEGLVTRVLSNGCRLSVVEN